MLTLWCSSGCSHPVYSSVDANISEKHTASKRWHSLQVYMAPKPRKTSSSSHYNGNLKSLLMHILHYLLVKISRQAVSYWLTSLSTWMQDPQLQNDATSLLMIMASQNTKNFLTHNTVLHQSVKLFMEALVTILICILLWLTKTKNYIRIEVQSASLWTHSMSKTCVSWVVYYKRSVKMTRNQSKYTIC